MAGSDDVTILVLGILIGAIFVIVSYIYGKSKGSEETLKRPDIEYPSLHDVTVLGKYSIPNQTNEQIIQVLSNWLTLEGYTASSFPNLIEIWHVRTPPQAQKKKNYFDRLALTRDGVPAKLTLNMHSSISGASTIEIDTICLPIMFNKLGQLTQQAFPKSSVEDAQRQCKDFTTNALCILNAEVLVSPYVESKPAVSKNMEFLYNTPSQGNINKKAHELIRNSRSTINLAGWVDREFLGDLESAKARGIEVKVITKSTEASDKIVKDDFGRLLKVFGKENIRINSRFHDRFLICDGNVIIGSIYYVDASKTRYESAICTDERDTVDGLISHFKRIWEDANSKPPQ